MDKFSQYNLNLTNKNKDLVTSYLQKIKNFIEKNDIEKELYLDIEEMVFEKLSNAKNLNQLTITKILKEVGEPEVIFSDYIEENSIFSHKKPINKTKKKEKESEKDNLDEEIKEDVETFYENMIKSGWIRDNKNAIVLGLSTMLAQKSKLPTWMIRTLFVIFAFAGGLGVYVYLILGIVLPIKGKDYKNKTAFQYFKMQIYYFLKDSITNLVVSIRKFIRRSFSIIFNFLKYIFNFTMKHIIPILRFIIFSLIGLTLAGIFLGAIVVGSAYFSSFTFDNIDFSSILPGYFIWCVITGIFSVGVFMVASFIYSVNGKWLNKYLLGSAFISLVIAIFLSFSTLFHVTQLYAQTNTITQQLQIEMEPNDNKDIVLDIYDVVNHNSFASFIDYQGISSVELVNEKSNNLRIEIKYEFLGNEEIANKIESSFGELKYTKSSSLIKIENPKMFTGKVPPAPFSRNITIYLPEGYTLKFNNYAPYFFYVTNAHLSSEYDKYSSGFNPNCSDKKMWYSVSEDRFICIMSDSQLKEAKKEYLKRYIIENFDIISPIQHKNEYKREYWNDGGTRSDWNFKNFYWSDGDKLNIEFGDMSLDIRASLNAKENESGVVEISDFKINNAQVEDYIFKTKYYIDITPIQPYLKSEYYDEYNEIYNNIDYKHGDNNNGEIYDEIDTEDDIDNINNYETNNKEQAY